MTISDRHSDREGAFTLVELVVVIATVGILAALILPAMARSGDNGARAVCLNNLRQMGMAASMYASDNNDSFTWSNWDGGSGGGPPGWLYIADARIPSPFVAPWNTPAGSDAAWKSGLWYQYVRNPKAYLCPIDVEAPTYVKEQRNNELSSYVMNAAVNNYQGAASASVYRLAKITDCWSPSCYLLYEPDENASGPGNPGAFEFNDGGNFPSAPPAGGEGIGRLHSANGGNMLCVGGNVQFVTTQAWATQSNGKGPGPGGKTLAWWSPFSFDGH